MINNNIYVIKVGSETVYDETAVVFEEIKSLLKQNKKVILVSGGAKSIKEYYDNNNLHEQFVKLHKNGDLVRYTDEKDILNIRQSYEVGVLARLKKKFKEYKVYCETGSYNDLISGEIGKPIKITQNNKPKILRGSHYGEVTKINASDINKLFLINDLIIVSPPISENNINSIINVDADMLASHLAVSVESAHLRFVTSTIGILQDINDSESLIKNIYMNTDLSSVEGRMKQKVRAANFALQNGYCDIKICGQNSLYNTSSSFWRMQEGESNKELKKVINIPSVSKDEEVLSNYLLQEYSDKFDESYIDNVGNIVFEKGKGKNTILLLGHIDTVPYYWTPKNKEDYIFGRGSVDAKSSFFNFVKVAEEITPPANSKIQVIGAVEEEVSSSKGAFYVRDNYKADYAIIGEPSGYDALTLGYFGLTKLEISVSKKREHSAAKDSKGIIEILLDYISHLKKFVFEQDKQHLSTILNIEKDKEQEDDIARCIINFRTSPKAPEKLLELILKFNEQYPNVNISILRSTRGYTCKRSNDLVKSFNYGFKSNNISNHKFLNKKGTSDMNTLATKWSIPMVAYGPGDSSLDHTADEKILLSEYSKTNSILKSALKNLLNRMESN